MKYDTVGTSLQTFNDVYGTNKLVLAEPREDITDTGTGTGFSLSGRPEEAAYEILRNSLEENGTWCNY